MSGKGDKQRPGENYSENWDKIFKKKDVMCGECWLNLNSVACTGKCKEVVKEKGLKK